MKKLLAMALALVMALGVTTMAWAEDTKSYSLAEFNALEAIPEGVTTVYVDLGTVDLKNEDVVVGNGKIADNAKDVWAENLDSAKEQGYTVKMNQVQQGEHKAYMVKTQKPGIKLVVKGTINCDDDQADVNAARNAKMISFAVPEASSIVLDGVTINGFLRLNPSWEQTGITLEGTSLNQTYQFKTKSFTFKGCTFNGIWLRSSTMETEKLTFDRCTFNNYTNSKDANNSNPLWFQGVGKCDIVITGCDFTTTRPVKVMDDVPNGTNVTGATLTVTGCTFDVSAQEGDKADEPKNVAVMFSNANGMGSVVIENNEVKSGAALVAFNGTNSVAEGASFAVSENKLGAGVKTSVTWKTMTETTPEFVEITPYTPEPTPPRYYYNSTTTTTDTKADGTKGSPKTFDAGVGIYAVTAVLSVTGMAWVGKKRH